MWPRYLQLALYLSRTLNTPYISIYGYKPNYKLSVLTNGVTGIVRHLFAKFLTICVTYLSVLFLSVLDSVGKPGSGILDGNVEWFGSFEQCKAVSEVKGVNVSFSTQYCLAPVVRPNVRY